MKIPIVKSVWHFSYIAICLVFCPYIWMRKMYLVNGRQLGWFVLKSSSSAKGFSNWKCHLEIKCAGHWNENSFWLVGQPSLEGSSGLVVEIEVEGHQAVVGLVHQLLPLDLDPRLVGFHAVLQLPSPSLLWRYDECIIYWHEEKKNTFFGPAQYNQGQPSSNNFGR